ncbi:MAG: hypothetical protein KatS3mg111_2585 [Pirellulaceae bacterium]|nr:MAG: hypothetical protein KatS3mg111_2585 [Pirellulaceae bacterium]
MAEFLLANNCMMLRANGQAARLPLLQTWTVSSMSRISAFVLGVLVGAVGLYVSENYYIVRGQESFHVVRKVAPRLDIPYRDIRSYTMEDWQKEPAVALAIIQSGKQELIVDSGVEQLERQVQNWLQSLGVQQ